MSLISPYLCKQTGFSQKDDEPLRRKEKRVRRWLCKFKYKNTKMPSYLPVYKYKNAIIITCVQIQIHKYKNAIILACVSRSNLFNSFLWLVLVNDRKCLSHVVDPTWNTFPLGREGCCKCSRNPGIAKIGLNQTKNILACRQFIDRKK